MTQAPPMTDRAALLRNRARAAGMTAPASFLHELAIDEIKERLETVNRTFTAPAVVTGNPRLWQRAFPSARVVADEDTLGLIHGAHDLVIHAMALHWANDPVGQIVQCRRALQPDGLFIALMFGGQTLFELRAALAQAESELTGGLSPRILPMGEIRDLGALLQRGGLALPVADNLTQTVLYRDVLHLMADLRAMGEGNALSARLRHPTRRSVLQHAAEIYAATHATDGRIPATFEIICLTGWAPHDSQQQPLRPGSAQTRLAQALNTAELPLTKGPHRG
ncbi:MAG: methyltransferase domain-containing protein [Paracoccaceae bacterium]